VACHSVALTPGYCSFRAFGANNQLFLATCAS
jgi:hypothetical protein